MTLTRASRAAGLDQNAFEYVLKTDPENQSITKLLIEDGKVFVPSLIEQIKWIPLNDAHAYIGMGARALRYFVFFSDLDSEIREFRRCRCITIDDVFKLAIWKVAKSWTKRKMPSKFRECLAALPVEGLVSLMRIVGEGRNAE